MFKISLPVYGDIEDGYNQCFCGELSSIHMPFRRKDREITLGICSKHISTVRKYTRRNVEARGADCSPVWGYSGNGFRSFESEEECFTVLGPYSLYYKPNIPLRNRNGLTFLD